MSLVLFVSFVVDPAAADRPNILWITAEDMSPDLGCYGVGHASTPHLDRLASQGVRYTHAFATIGVCAPARSTIITGMYPTSLGTQHMRCRGRLPDYVKCFSENLRDAGYYCTNNPKEDYNFKTPESAWDESSGKAHWRNRPRKEQPFFAVFNLGVTHESQTWEENASKNRVLLPPERRQDPATIPIPPYHPDVPEVRRDWANYHDNISVMDGQAADILKQLDEDGLADNTIVFFFSDHGAGMPRSKRWLYDSSLRVPLIVRFPEKWKHLSPGAPGSTVDRLVSFIDFAPTMLSLVGVEIPAHMQGVAFLGAKSGEPREYIYGFRDRMDARYDMIRCVRDKRYKYIRNYYPHRPYFHAQHLGYAHRMPTLRVWQELSKHGKLNDVQALWMGERKPAEELYDTETDPWEVKSLADDPGHGEVLERMRAVHLEWIVDTGDLGFLPEAEMRARAEGTTEYEWARESEGPYALGRIAETALLADQPKTSAELQSRLKDGDAAVRYWAVVGLGRRIRSAPNDWLMQVQGMLHGDPSWSVRVAAAEALARWGKLEGVLEELAAALAHEDEFVRLAAANLVDDLDGDARPLRPRMEQAAKDRSENVRDVMGHALRELE